MTPCWPLSMQGKLEVVLGQANGQRPSVPSASDASFGGPVTMLVLAKASGDESSPWPWPRGFASQPPRDVMPPTPISTTRPPQESNSGAVEQEGADADDGWRAPTDAGVPHGVIAGVYGGAQAVAAGLPSIQAGQVNQDKMSGTVGKQAGYVDDKGAGEEAAGDDADLRQVIQTCNCCLSETSSHAQVCAFSRRRCDQKMTCSAWMLWDAMTCRRAFIKEKLSSAD